MTSRNIGKRYAKALLALGREQDLIDDFLNELRVVNTVLTENETLRRFLSDPRNGKEVKRSVVQEIVNRLKSHPRILNFVSLITDKGRIGIFSEITAVYEDLANAAMDRTIARVIVATEPEKEEREELKNKLSAYIGKQVEISVSVDPSIIGGAIAFTESLQIDGSTRNHLRQIRKLIL